MIEFALAPLATVTSSVSSGDHAMPRMFCMIVKSAFPSPGAKKPLKLPSRSYSVITWRTWSATRKPLPSRFGSTWLGV